jgi:hypothetical protein
MPVTFEINKTGRAIGMSTDEFEQTGPREFVFIRVFQLLIQEKRHKLRIYYREYLLLLKDFFQDLKAGEKNTQELLQPFQNFLSFTDLLTSFVESYQNLRSLDESIRREKEFDLEIAMLAVESLIEDLNPTQAFLRQHRLQVALNPLLTHRQDVEKVGKEKEEYQAYLQALTQFFVILLQCGCTPELVDAFKQSTSFYPEMHSFIDAFVFSYQNKEFTHQDLREAMIEMLGSQTILARAMRAKILPQDTLPISPLQTP